MNIKLTKEEIVWLLDLINDLDSAYSLSKDDNLIMKNILEKLGTEWIDDE